MTTHRALAGCALLAFSGLAVQAAAADQTVAALDLAKPFATRSPWRAIVTQGPPSEDYGGNPAPGVLRICLKREPNEPCDAPPDEPATIAGQPNGFVDPHELRTLKVVHAHGASGAPLLLIQTGSIRAGDGGQIILTHLMAYQRDGDRFAEVYRNRTGSNNNQETRFMLDGPLAGDVVSADPTSDAPYGFWITVNAWGQSGAYKAILRYRSATRYNDGNRLAVVDSEMPGILRRLNLWREGDRLPAPAGRCARPHLVTMELWCD